MLDESASPAVAAFVAAHRENMNPRFKGAWLDDYWIASGVQNVADRARFTILFCDGTALGEQERRPFLAPFGEFARAICNAFADSKVISPGGPGVFLNLIGALRFVYAQLPHGEKDPARLSGVHFTDAEQAILRVYGGGFTADQFVGKLVTIAEIVDAARLLPRRLAWARTFHFDENSQFTGEAMERRIAEKLLSEQDMLAWATLSADPGPNAIDRLCQRVVDLMLCGGFRIHEALSLPYDTLVKELVYAEDGTPATNASGQAVVRYGLRYWPQKGSEGVPLVKPIPTLMGPVAERAVNEVRQLTRRARAVALAFFEQRTPFDEDPWDTLDAEDYWLTPTDVGYLLGKRRRQIGAGHQFIKNEKLRTYQKEFDGVLRTVVLKSELEAKLRAKSFARYRSRSKHGRIELHDCLFVVPWWLGGRSPGLDGTAGLMQTVTISTYLAERYPWRPAYQPVGATDVGAKPDKKTATHMFRAWLATTALRHNLSVLDLALWLGHRGVKRVRSYDLRRPTEVAEQISMARHAVGATEDGDEEMQDPLPSFAEAAREGMTGHVTALGACQFHYQSKPCDFFARYIEHDDSDLLDSLTPAEFADLLDHSLWLAREAKSEVAAKTSNAKAWLDVTAEASAFFSSHGRDAVSYDAEPGASVDGIATSH